MPAPRQGGRGRYLTDQSLFVLEGRVHEEERDGVTRGSLRARNALALAHLDAGRPATAVEVLERVVDECRRLLGENDPDTVVATGNLGYAWTRIDRWEQGFTIMNDNLALRERMFGEVDPVTMTGRHGLAVAYQDAGLLPEALRLFTSVAAQRARTLGPAHPDTLASRVALAIARAESGDVEGAVPGLTAALQDAEQSVGPRSVSTILIRVHLADCHTELGNTTEALSGLSRAATDGGQVFGPTDPLVLTLQNDARAVAAGSGAENPAGDRVVR